MADLNLKIFSVNRIRLDEMYSDAMAHIRSVYNDSESEFTAASPFGQILQVVLNLGRMILFYIENSITEMNIETAYQARSIRGLAQLTGHEPSRGVSARGVLYMSYNRDSDYAGESIYIKNYTKIKNTSNGLPYIAIFPTNTMQLTVGESDSKIEIPIIQGVLKYQRATGTGYMLQSFNFANRGDDMLDQFFMNVYVNGERWETVKSILDMTYQQKACIIRTSMAGGTDVFFGTGNNGAIPPAGSTILFEYLVTGGMAGNISSAMEDNYWTFDDDGYDINGDYVNLNSIYNLTSGSDILFGSEPEDIEMTRMLAPHMSRSFVLANPINYKTFLSKLNIFSIIDAFSGFNTYEDQRIEIEYNEAKLAYESAKESYMAQVNHTGKSSQDALDKYAAMNAARDLMDAAKVRYDAATLDDNTVYLYLVPDLSKRLAPGESYFTCGEDRFYLTEDEKTAVLNLIEDSGQKIITAENKILDPIFVRFSINIFVQMFNNFDFRSVKSSITSAISEYLINNNRRDAMPISDIVRIIQDIDGVDSVTAFFDADKNNERYYGEGKYGIDEYGDIILTRSLTDKIGNTVEVNDLRPLFRGPFVSKDGVEYGESESSILSSINITLRGRTVKA